VSFPAGGTDATGEIDPQETSGKGNFAIPSNAKQP
jgi:hypothetical protein